MTSRKTQPAKPIITSPSPNDVLFGRGAGVTVRKGNERFRRLIHEHKDEYARTHRRQGAKAKIAREVFDKIHALGGRFLKRVENQNPTNDTEDAIGHWEEVDEGQALEKCMQALRDVLRERDLSRRNRARENPSEDNFNAPSKRNTTQDPHHSNSMALLPRNTTQDRHPSNSTAILPTAMFSRHTGTVGALTTAHTEIVLFQGIPWGVQQQQIIRQSTGLEPLTYQQGATSLYPTTGTQSTLFNQSDPRHTNLIRPDAGRSATQLRNVSTTPPTVTQSTNTQKFPSFHGDSGSLGVNPFQATNRNSVDAQYTETPASPQENTSVSDTDVSDFLLCSILGEANRPKFTEEQVQMERASLTEQESEAAFSDMFGRMCSVHTSKRARKDLDPETVSLLVKQMRLEMEGIPTERKQVFLEAQSKCNPEEFTDSRLERFLRCEGMNPKLGAERFVRYWKWRREVFGPEKYTQRMTLSEALRDDLVALETGVFYLLPLLDMSGRQIQVVDPSRHSRVGYTSESLLRAFWYVVEVASRENKDIDSGIVHICWSMNFTIWDYDRIAFDRALDFYMNCWPIKIISCHICRPQSLVSHVIKPIVYAMMGKELRSRVVVHDVPASQIPGVLLEYGIREDMLPTTMGGTLEFSQSEWIANRRAAELEEI